MKINLLTFHGALSFGAVLQAYSLSHFLTALGHDVYIVDLRPPWIWPRREAFRPGLWLKRWKFEHFLKQYLPPLTITYRDQAELRTNPPPGDVFIVGSDQVWNPSITRSMASLYFLDFVPDGVKRVSYAASFGTDEIEFSDEDRERIASLLKRFDAASVREQSGIIICQDLGGISAAHVLDPVFLLEDYASLYKPFIAKEKKLVCYKFIKDPMFGDVLDLVSNTLVMPAYILDSKGVGAARGIRVHSPEKWLNWLRQSSFVFTDSFHAFAFALIFEKNFIVMPSIPKRFGRIKELCVDLGLEDRIFGSYKEIVDDHRWQQPINYAVVKEKLNDRVRSSMDFLRRALSNGQEA